MRALGFLAALALMASGCTSEASSPIDLNTTLTTSPPVTGLPDLPEDDPNAEARQQVIDLAKEECRKDPSAEFGVIVIADENGVEVNRYEYPCAELDAEDATTTQGDGGGEE